MNAQRELYLPERPTSEILEERLVLAVSEFNEHLVTPERRIELHGEILRLRGHLRKGEP